MGEEMSAIRQNSIDHENVVARFRRKLGALLWLKHSLFFITVWCFIWGLLALILRAAFNLAAGRLLWGAIGIVVATVAAFFVARRSLPSPVNVRALLDKQNECGGLLMASEDASLGGWNARLPQLSLPKLHWRSSKSWSLFAASLVFVVSSFVVPARFASSESNRALDVSREVNDLAQKIELLKEEKVIDEARAETLEERLNQLGAEAAGEDPAKTWEALDHLADSVKKAADEASETAAETRQSLEIAQSLAEGLASGGDRMDSKLLAEAMQSLKGMMEEAIKENEALAAELSPELQEALKSGSLSSEQLKDLANALGGKKAGLDQKLAKLKQVGSAGKNGAIDPNSLKSAQAGKRNNAGLSEFLKENAQRMSVEDAMEAWCSGKGGVDRGRGDAEMTWTDGSNEKDARFKEKTLPPSAIAGLNESSLVGLSQAAPTVETHVTAHGALNKAAAGGGSAYTQTILPRHKGAVKRYFDRDRKK